MSTQENMIYFGSTWMKTPSPLDSMRQISSVVISDIRGEKPARLGHVGETFRRNVISLVAFNPGTHSLRPRSFTPSSKTT